MNERNSSTKGHVWQTYKDNGKGDSEEIDDMAYEIGECHSGPRCKVCGYGYCDLCYDEPQENCDGEE